MDRIYIDFETRSEIDLKKVGAAVYAAHPTTEILCIVYGYAKPYYRSVNCRYQNSTSIEAFAELKFNLGSGKFLVEAHNAEFEYHIYHEILVKRCSFYPIPIERWRDSMAVCAYRAYPQSLENAAKALELDVEKDMEGRRLMLKMSKPRKPTLTCKDKWHQSPQDMERLIKYCQKDVETEYEISQRLGDLPETEQKVWFLHLKMNTKGIKVDIPLIKRIIELINIYQKDVQDTVTKQTHYKLLGQDLRSVQQVLNHLYQECDLNLSNLQKETILKFIEENANSKDGKIQQAIQLLKSRLILSKSSVSKFESMINHAGEDGRIRGSLNYYGATTGRWAGRGIQPQNLPRPVFDDTEKLIHDVNTLKYVDLKEKYNHKLMDVFSSLLRPCIVADEGKTFMCADYASIEVRVLFWLVDHQAGLKMLRDGEDIYSDMARRIYDIELIQDVTKEQRQLGKVAILGCGYGMGASKFHKTCLSWGVDIDEDDAKKAVDTYRDTYSLVKNFWYKIDDLCKNAIMKPNQVYGNGKISVCFSKDTLQIKLPSNRILYYPQAKLDLIKTSWGDMKESVMYKTQNTFNNRKFEYVGTYGGKLTENIVQAIARDLLVNSMFNLEENGYPVVLTVHDEILCEVDENLGNGEELKKFFNVMNLLPDWASDLPIESEGWYGKRYQK